MKAKHLSFIIFWLFLLGAYSVNAADEKIINGQVDNNSVKMIQGQLPDAESINIEENPGVDLVGKDAGNSKRDNNANITKGTNAASPALQPAEPATHGALIIDKSDKSKKSFELSNKTPKAAWRKNKMAGAQALDRKAEIKPSKELQGLETKRKNMKASRKKELESKPARRLLKSNSDGKEDAP